MKSLIIASIFMVSALTACTQLSEEDRALLMQTQTTAEQAKNAAVEAADAARAARADADKAAKAAQAASEKADRIFRQGQNK